MATEWLSELKGMVEQEYGRVYAWDVVNAPMVRQWCEVMGIDNPLYTDEEYAKKTEFDGLVAPPAMLQAWCLEGLNMNNYPPGSTKENPYGALKLLEEHGFPAVVAVNSELSFDRYVTMGEKLYYTTLLKEIGDEKTTALGTGFFVTLVMSFFSEKEATDEKVGELLFRVFKFKPHQQPEQASTTSEIPVIKRPKPGISDDTRFFWEGCDQKELRIQHCKSCDELQHPPGPVCSHCQSFELDYKVVEGAGELYSFVVMHYPEVPPFDYPNPIGLIQLDEGIRIPAGLVGVERRDELKIGQRVQVEFHNFDDEMTLPMFRLVDSNHQQTEGQ